MFHAKHIVTLYRMFRNLHNQNEKVCSVTWMYVYTYISISVESPGSLMHKSFIFACVNIASSSLVQTRISTHGF